MAQTILYIVLMLIYLAVGIVELLAGNTWKALYWFSVIFVTLSIWKA